MIYFLNGHIIIPVTIRTEKRFSLYLFDIIWVYFWFHKILFSWRLPGITLVFCLFSTESFLYLFQINHMWSSCFERKFSWCNILEAKFRSPWLVYELPSIRKRQWLRWRRPGLGIPSQMHHWLLCRWWLWSLQGWCWTLIANLARSCTNLLLNFWKFISKIVSITLFISYQKTKLINSY